MTTNPIGGFNVLVLPGDGIGPEVIDAAVKVLETLCKKNGISLDLEFDLLGGEAFDKFGTFCRDQTAAAAADADAVLIGAVGGPKWDDMVIDGSATDKDGLMRLRQELSVFAGIRPARSYPSLLDHTPYKPQLVDGADILVLREMCGGCFFREPRGIVVNEDGSRDGFDTNLYSSVEIERFARVGFELARRRKNKLISIDKSNVLESNVLWRDCVSEIGKLEFPDVELVHMYADNALYQMVRDPTCFDVVLSDNLFGDLASDLAATVSGSLGMLPSGCIAGLNNSGQPNRPGIFEPVHGSAPDIAGQGIANPIGAILSVAMMFEFAFARGDISAIIEDAVLQCLNDGVITPDLGGSAGTIQVTDRIIRVLS